MTVKAWSEMTGEERQIEANAIAKLFVGLPGVVGAPLVMGPGYWEDIAMHLVECGVRVVAGSIKHYEVAVSLDKADAAGRWVYDTDAPEESHQEKLQRLAKEQNRAHLAKVEAMREAGELPPENATREQRDKWRRKRVANAEARAFTDEVRDRRENGTLAGSPNAQVKKPRKKK